MDEEKKTPGRPQIYQGWHEERRPAARKKPASVQPKNTSVIEPEQVLRRTRSRELPEGPGRLLAGGARLSDSEAFEETPVSHRKQEPEETQAAFTPRHLSEDASGKQSDDGRREAARLRLRAQEAEKDVQKDVQKDVRKRPSRPDSGQKAVRLQQGKKTGQYESSAKETDASRRRERTMEKERSQRMQKKAGQSGDLQERRTGSAAEDTAYRPKVAGKRHREQENEAKLRMLWIAFGVLVVLLVAAIVHEIVLGHGIRETGGERMEQKRQEKMLKDAGNSDVTILPGETNISDQSSSTDAEGASGQENETGTTEASNESETQSGTPQSEAVQQ